MTTIPTPNDAEREALEYVRDVKAFYSHLITFALVNLLLLGINLWVSPGYLWVIWSVLGWGIGLVSHALSVFEVFDVFSPDWERKQVEKRLRKTRG